MERFLTAQTGVPVFRAEHPMIAVAAGCGRALEDPALFRRILQNI
jgi:actin-like ATPase involved in cell morphogenesis